MRPVELDRETLSLVRGGMIPVDNCDTYCGPGDFRPGGSGPRQRVWDTPDRDDTGPNDLSQSL